VLEREVLEDRPDHDLAVAEAALVDAAGEQGHLAHALVLGDLTFLDALVEDVGDLLGAIFCDGGLDDDRRRVLPRPAAPRKGAWGRRRLECAPGSVFLR
jgi:hypothetical protein